MEHTLALKRQKDKTLKQWLIPKLRKISSHWPNKNKCLANAREKIIVGEYKNGNPIYKSMYRCAGCEDLFDSSEVQVDHISPIVNLEGFKDWNTYIPDLFCEIDNLQILCKCCHISKSNVESSIRREKKKISK